MERNPERQKIIDKLEKAAELLRDIGGEEEYDLADACEDAARILRNL